MSLYLTSDVTGLGKDDSIPCEANFALLFLSETSGRLRYRDGVWEEVCTDMDGGGVECTPGDTEVWREMEMIVRRPVFDAVKAGGEHPAAVDDYCRKFLTYDTLLGSIRIAEKLYGAQY